MPYPAMSGFEAELSSWRTKSKAEIEGMEMIDCLKPGGGQEFIFLGCLNFRSLNSYVSSIKCLHMELRRALG